MKVLDDIRLSYSVHFVRCRDARVINVWASDNYTPEWIMFIDRMGLSYESIETN